MRTGHAITTTDGTQISYKDWGAGQPITADLQKIDVPTLVIHGDDDQIVPIDAAGRAAAKLIKNARLIVYPGAPHGITDTHKDQLNADLLAFLKA